MRVWIDPERFVGEVFDFYGAHSCQFKLDDQVFEVVEDENDGYRSACDGVALAQDPVAFHEHLGRVRVEIDPETDFQGYRLVDVDTKHVWLRWGTAEYDDYYPCFTFHFEPAPPTPRSLLDRLEAILDGVTLRDRAELDQALSELREVLEK